MNRIRHQLSSRRRLAVVAALTLVAFAATTVAFAYLQGTGSGEVTAKEIQPGNTPDATVENRNSVKVTITQNSVSNQLLGAYTGGGYTVWRKNALDPNAQHVRATDGCAALVRGTGATLTCTETGLADGTWSYTVIPQLNNWMGARSDADSVTVLPAAPVDVTAPKLKNIEIRDTGTPNGKIDQIKVIFDEQLKPATSSPAAAWTVQNLPGAANNSTTTPTSVAVSGDTVTLTVTEPTSNRNTALGNVAVQFTTASSDVQDPAGNKATSFTYAQSQAAGVRVDKAAPHLTQLTCTASGNSSNRKLAADGNSSEPGSAVTWTVRQGTTTLTPPQASTPANNGNFGFNNFGVTAGAQYTVEARQTDAAGNPSNVAMCPNGSVTA